MDIANIWLQSGLPAFIRSVRLVPTPHPKYDNIAYHYEGAQGRAYQIIQESNKRKWVIKKFKKGMQPDSPCLAAVRSLVPRGIAFRSASKRVILSSGDLKWGDGLYSSKDFGKWIENSILMPKMPGKSWQEVAREIRTGRQKLPMVHRIGFAKYLAEAVKSMENNACAHRDLSNSNMLVDLREYVIYLVDWDSLFHGSIYFHENTPAGTEGYMAPWVKENGKWNAKKSWNRKADRFSLAILIAELLLVNKGTARYHDGCHFAQEMFFNARQSYITKTIEALHNISESLGHLFQQTIIAKSYDDCPDPLNWFEALEDVVLDENGEAKKENQVEEIEEEEEEDDEEYEEFDEIISSDSVEKTMAARINYWWLFLILLMPLIALIIYQIKDRTQTSYFKKTTKSSAAKIPFSNTSTNKTDKLPTRKYMIKVLYTDNDLDIRIKNQRIPLNSDNSSWIEIPKGIYEVSITFTGVVFYKTGKVARTSPITKKRKIQFGNDQRITIKIYRKDKTWQLISSY